MLRAFHIVVVVLAWAGAGYKAADLVRRPPGDFGRVAVCLALLFFALAFTVGLPPLYQRIPWLAEGASTVRLIQHGLAVLSLFWIQMFVAHVTPRTGHPVGGIVLRTATVSVILASMVVLFGLAAPGAAAEDFVGTYAKAPFVTEYLLAFLGYTALVLADISRLTLRYAGGATERPMRIGLRLWSIASLVGFAYASHKASYAVAARLDRQPPWYEGPVSTVLSGLVLVLFVVGLTAYTWGPRIARAGRRWRQYRTYRALLPLWRACYDVMPGIALVPPDARRVPIDLRLYRCVIEILDGRLALRAYWDTRIAEQRGEAAALAAALAAKARNEPTDRAPTGLPALDVAELTSVARDFRSLPAAATPPVRVRG
ncbi:MAB_1171c family putative transporter [Saccharothrix deserti]|uniref:MAB_1171c family putative transporter n=1 Tax=Saccharothrix deserti TaxID=2593674 RepID=UPI00131BE580|nr:MAB_1171c family putative transporter [Saccharothrix deserti]